MDHPLNPNLPKTVTISLYEIVEYFSGIKRSIREVEEIVKGGWIYAIGISPPPSTDEITGLVIAPSAISSKPHEVKLKHLTQSHKRWILTCSCKARKCKHIAGCLIQINRHPNLQQLSSTDLTQKWGKVEKEFVQQYNGVGVLELCHKAIKKNMKNDIVTNETFQEFLKDNPHSELKKLFFGLRSTIERSKRKEKKDYIC